MEIPERKDERGGAGFFPELGFCIKLPEIESTSSWVPGAPRYSYAKATIPS